MKVFLVYVVCTVWASSLLAIHFSLSDTTIANGASAYIEFEKEEGIVYKRVKLGKKSFQIFQHPLKKDRLYALIAVGYYAKPKIQNLKIYFVQKGLEKIETIKLKVKEGLYTKESIVVSKSKVNPKGKTVNERISKEYHEAMNLYAKSTKENYLHSGFILPMQSFITSDFGKARVYNGSLKGYHSGTDFRAKVGTPILASNDGVVVLIKKRFYSGGTVIIDHGQGVYSCYYHMSKFLVQKNQKITKRDIIGLSGKSGRVTGPHLHFSVRVGGVQVDPLQFVHLMNENILEPKDR